MKCREEWRKSVVEFMEVVQRAGSGEKNHFPFKEGWDLADRAELLERLRKRLAKVGQGLFHQVFGKGNDEDAQCLAEILAGDQPFSLRITSDSFYVPWGLIYTHPSTSGALESDFSQAPDRGFGGFWGLRHVIYHRPKVASYRARRLDSVDGKLAIAAYIDSDLFTKYQLLQLPDDWKHLAASLRLAVRQKRREFEAAFSADPLSDRVAHFFCHGFGSDDDGAASTRIPKIVISKDFEIDRQDLENLRRNRKFRPPPFIFINACQGGQVGTLFFKTVAEAFLSLDAIGIIGPQIDIPVKFAAEYAKRFLSRLIEGPNQNSLVTIGSIVRELAQEFVARQRNPLGLVYSLYCGGECSVDLGRGGRA